MYVPAWIRSRWRRRHAMGPRPHLAMTQLGLLSEDNYLAVKAALSGAPFTAAPLIFTSADIGSRSKALASALAKVNNDSYVIQRRDFGPEAFSRVFITNAVLNELALAASRLSPLRVGAKELGRRAGDQIAAFKIPNILEVDLRRATPDLDQSDSWNCLMKAINTVNTSAVNARRGIVLAFDRLEELASTPDGIYGLTILLAAVTAAREQGVPIVVMGSMDPAVADSLAAKGVNLSANLRPVGALSVPAMRAVIARARLTNIVDPVALFTLTKGHPVVVEEVLTEYAIFVGKGLLPSNDPADADILRATAIANVQARLGTARVHLMITEAQAFWAASITTPAGKLRRPVTSPAAELAVA